MFVRVAPGAVQNLKAVAEDSVSIRVSWRIPAQPNGMITQYRLQVLVDDILLQDITLTADVVRQMLHHNLKCIQMQLSTDLVLKPEHVPFKEAWSSWTILHILREVVQ